MRGRPVEWTPEQRERHNVKARTWRQRNPEKSRAIYRKYYYGITDEEYHEKIEQQRGLCAICGEPPQGREGTADCRLHVDHNHSTRVVRELICGPCNRMLGQAKEDTSRLRRGADYLERHSA